MKILACSVQKGGCGKTATVHALGDALARAGRRTLLVDLDPQHTLTSACNAESDPPTMVALLREQATAAACAVELRERLFIIPADIELATVELELSGVMGREAILRRALVKVAPHFDVAIIDTPPSLGLLTINALTAADAVLIPTQPQISDLRGVRLFLGTLDKLRERLNPGLQTLGIVATFHDPRLLHHQDAIELMKQSGLPLLPVTIGRSVKVAEAAASGESVITYAPGNPRSAEYLELTRIVDEWLKSDHD